MLAKLPSRLHLVDYQPLTKLIYRRFTITKLTMSGYISTFDYLACHLVISYSVDPRVAPLGNLLKGASQPIWDDHRARHI